MEQSQNKNTSTQSLLGEHGHLKTRRTLNGKEILGKKTLKNFCRPLEDGLLSGIFLKYRRIATRHYFGNIDFN